MVYLKCIKGDSECGWEYLLRNRNDCDGNGFRRSGWILNYWVWMVVRIFILCWIY